MNKIEKYESLIDKFKKAKPIEKKREKLNDLYKLKRELLDIDEKVEEWLNKDKIYFNITTRNDIELVYFIFHNGEQTSLGDEWYHNYRITINKQGLRKLEKLLKKVQFKIDKLESQV